MPAFGDIRHQIMWKDMKTRSVRDGIGRELNWTELEGKTIYICGHGGHIWKDGYFTVPIDTTVNFYQPYRCLFDGETLADFIPGKVKWEPERSFGAGQSCPNMTLFDDDEHSFNVANDALREKLKSSPDKANYYIFNCNQFKELPVYTPFAPKFVHLSKEERAQDKTYKLYHDPEGIVERAQKGDKMGGRQMLKLKDILYGVNGNGLNGNTIEWCCCQDIMDVREYITEKRAFQEGAGIVDIRGVSKTVKDGLQKVKLLQSYLAVGYNKTTLPANNKDRWTGSGSYFGEWKLEDNKWVFEGRHTPDNPAIKTLSNLALGKAREKSDFVAQRQRVEKCLTAILAALDALLGEHQPSPVERGKARAVLTRARDVCENYLRETLKYTYM